MSLAVHAATWRIPLLIQLPDGEYRLGLEAVSALQLAGAPFGSVVSRLRMAPEDADLSATRGARSA